MHASIVREPRCGEELDDGSGCVIGLSEKYHFGVKPDLGLVPSRSRDGVAGTILVVVGAAVQPMF